MAGVVKLGASLAVTSTLLHPLKAPRMLVQAMVPHCLILVILARSVAVLLKKIRGNPALVVGRMVTVKALPAG